MTNRPAALIILLLAIAQPLAGALAPVFGIGTPVGAATADARMPDQPLSFFFSIWSVIFLAYGAFGLAGLVRPERWPQPLALPLILAGIGNIVWMLSAQLIVWQPLDFLLLFPILGVSFLAAQRAQRLRDMGGEAASGAGFMLGDITSGLLSGWLSAALSISIPLTLRSFTNLGATDFPWLMVWSALIPVALLAFIFTTRISRSLWFFAAAGWGILGIACQNWLETGMHLIGHVTAGFLLILLLVRLTRGANKAKLAQ